MNVSKFDSDPEALAWARDKVQGLVDKLRDFERQATESDSGNAKQWRVAANTVESHLIGGSGCVIAAFDERMPSLAPVLAQITAEQDAKQAAARARIRERNARLGIRTDQGGSENG